MSAPCRIFPELTALRIKFEIEVRRLRDAWSVHCVSSDNPFDFKINYTTFINKIFISKDDFIKEYDLNREVYKFIAEEDGRGHDVIKLMEDILLMQVEEILIDGEADKALD